MKLEHREMTLNNVNSEAEPCTKLGTGPTVIPNNNHTVILANHYSPCKFNRHVNGKNEGLEVLEKTTDLADVKQRVESDAKIEQGT